MLFAFNDGDEHKVWPAFAVYCVISFWVGENHTQACAEWRRRWACSGPASDWTILRWDAPRLLDCDQNECYFARLWVGLCHTPNYWWRDGHIRRLGPKEWHPTTPTSAWLIRSLWPFKRPNSRNTLEHWSPEKTDQWCPHKSLNVWWWFKCLSIWPLFGYYYLVFC